MPFVRPYRGRFALGCLGLLAGSLLALPGPLLIGQVTDRVFLGSRSLEQLLVYLAVIAGLYIVGYAVSIATQTAFVRINNLVVNDMRTAVMSKVMDLPMSYLSGVEKGYVQARIQECSSIGTLFTPSVISTFFTVVQATMAIVTMFVLNWMLALVVVGLAPVVLLTSRSSGRALAAGAKENMESTATLNAACFEIVNGIEDIKILNGKAPHLKLFAEKIARLVESGVKLGRMGVVFMGNILLVNNATSLLILFVAGLLILHGQFTVGLFLTFSQYSTQVFSSTTSISTLITFLKPVCLGTERLYELLDMAAEDGPGAHELTEPIRRLDFEDVSFRYGDELPLVLGGVSFSIDAGERVLLQGANGSGKTTILKLLLALYRPTSGRITINGEDSCNLRSADLRRRIAVVSQSIFLFHGTVLDNILLGQQGKTRSDVEALISRLGMERFFSRLADGLDTEITQSSSSVSGGQAQVIALVRALLSDSDVMLLDEPVANVDAEARDLVVGCLERGQFNGMLIVISHQTEGLEFLRRRIRI